MMEIPRSIIVSIVCLFLGTRLLVAGSTSTVIENVQRRLGQDECSIGDIDKDVEEQECSDSLGNRIETHKSIVSTVPGGTVCYFSCIDGEMKRFRKKCIEGVWEGAPFECGTDEEYSEKKKKKRQRRWFWSSSSSSEEPPPPPPNTAPVMQNCPIIPSVINADRLSTYAIVRWTPPRAHDKEQGFISVSQISGGRPGSKFSERTHSIVYTATDNKGLRASCSTLFRVRVVVCRKPGAPSSGTISCSQSRLIYGSHCTYRCNSGFSISGTTTVYCGLNGRFSSTSTTCVDVTPPKFTSCPPSETVFAKRNERTALASWRSITATDNSGSSVTITQISGPLKGTTVSPGNYQIQYSAVDRTGHKADPCIFTLTVKVTKCQTPNMDFINYTCTTEDFLFGTTCQVSCEYGYSLTGGNTITCDQTNSPTEVGEWIFASQPTCVKVRCTRPNQPADGTLVCTDEKLEWGATCSASCDDGYRMMGPSVLTCLKDGVFDDDVATCVDNIPPVFDSCPSPIEVYADRNMRRATVTWPRPHASDNLGTVTVTQKKGYRSGSLFNSGVTQVYFDAVDGAGNKAKACIFTVTVLWIKCPLPDLRDDFLVYACSEADYLFGTTCALSCHDGMVVDGSDEIACESKSPSALEGVWVENKDSEPRCFKEIKCPALDPPENGVIVCEAHSGVCQIQCNRQYDSNRVYSEKDDVMFVCGSSGKWIPNSAIFTCNGEHSTRRRLPTTFFYYNDQCQNRTTKMTIESNFEGAFLTSAFGRGCGDRCTFDQLYVNCS